HGRELAEPRTVALEKFGVLVLVLGRSTEPQLTEPRELAPDAQQSIDHRVEVGRGLKLRVLDPRDLERVQQTGRRMGEQHRQDLERVVDRQPTPESALVAGDSELLEPEPSVGTSDAWAAELLGVALEQFGLASG